MFTAYLTNFGNEVCRGDNLPAVIKSVEKTGFECYIMQEKDVVMFWSPIRGWTKFTIKQLEEESDEGND